MKSVRAYLVALVITCMLLATIGFGVVLWQARETSRHEAAAQARETAQALSQAVDGELERAAGVLSALAASQAMRTRDWAALDREARAAFAKPDAWIVVHDRTGKQWVNTRLPFGSKKPQTTPPAEMWQAFDAGKRHICNLSQGAVERQIVCVDVAESSVRPAQYALSVVLRPRVFQSIVRRRNVEDGQLSTLVDRNGVVIWRNIRPETFIGRTASGEMLQHLGSGRPQGSLQTKSLEGIPMLSAYQKSASSGWSVIVGVPLSSLDGNVRSAVLHGSIFALIVIVLGCVLAAIFGRRLDKGLRSLAHLLDPKADLSQVQPIGLAEFDAAANALKASSLARSRSERNQQMLIGELNHRVKNTLAVVQSLAHQTFRGESSPEASISAFESRLQALGSAHNLLTRESWMSAQLAEIVGSALAPFCTQERCRIAGPDVTVPPQTAVSLALALHELATNAVKYGALSRPEGMISVTWMATSESFELTWEEKGGPRVNAPLRQGFGTRLIQRSLAAELNGQVAMDFRPEGLLCRVVGALSPTPRADVLRSIAEDERPA